MDPISGQVGPLSSTSHAKQNQGNDRDQQLMKAAEDLEASFLAEMLKHAGVGKPRDSFGGGIGEDQFSSFLVQEQAKGLVQSGGIGLAESLFEALKERSGGAI